MFVGRFVASFNQLESRLLKNLFDIYTKCTLEVYTVPVQHLFLI